MSNQQIVVTHFQESRGAAHTPDKLARVFRADPQTPFDELNGADISERIDPASHEYRAALCASLSEFIRPPEVASVRKDGWNPENLVRGGGCGLTIVPREELALAVTLIQAGIDRSPLPVRVAFDRLGPGLVTATVVEFVCRAYGVPCEVSYTPQRGRSIRLNTGSQYRPIAMADAIARRARRARRTRAAATAIVHNRRDRNPEVRTTVGVYASNARAVHEALPVLEELVRRKVATSLASPAELDGETPALPSEVMRVDASPRRVTRQRWQQLRRAVDAMPIDLVPLGREHDGPAADILRRLFARRLAQFVPGMLGAIHSARKLTECDTRVTFQATGNHSPANRVFMVQAQAGGAFACMGIHGLNDPLAPEHHYAVPADAVLVWGDTMAERFRSNHTHRRYEVVGHPVIDERLRAVKSQRRQSTNKPPLVVVVFGRPGRLASTEYFSDAVAAVARLARANPYIDVVVNLHPGDDGTLWRHRVQDAPVRITRDEFYTLLPHASAVITMHSTTGGEAAAVGVPVLALTGIDGSNGHGQHLAPAQPDYVREGAAYQVSTYVELERDLAHVIASGPDHDRLAEARASYAIRFLTQDPRGSAALTADVLAKHALVGE